MNALRAWVAEYDKPLHQRTVKRKYKEIFGGNLTREEAMTVFVRAKETGVLVIDRDSKRGGYVLAEGAEQ